MKGLNAMKAVLIAPRKYVQGPDVLSEAGALIAAIGKRPLVLWDKKVKSIVGKTLLASLAEAKLKVADVAFAGDSTHAEVDRVAKLAVEAKADVIVGVGGGKALDTAKAAAAKIGSAMITIPTIASNDSPTSSYTVWYDEKGNCLGFESWGRNPDLVLVDTRVIANGPVRAFVAGMGDALATWIEARVCLQTRSANLAGGVSTQAAMALARLGYDILLEYGVEAKRAVEAKVVTPAVEKVVEANVLLSGMGFESGGVATAHMIANCLPSLPECHALMHGQEVGFGIISQLCLEEDVEVEEIYRIVDFEIAIGLPVTFADLGLAGVKRQRLEGIGKICAGAGSLCHYHPFKVTPESIIDAMIAADALGAARKKLARALPANE
jgi:glycerol dehydrogenase